MAQDKESGSTDQSRVEKEFCDFDPNNFDRSTNIDNEWFPMKPGTRFVYEGFTVSRMISPFLIAWCSSSPT